MFPLIQRMSRIITTQMRGTLNSSVPSEWNNLVPQRLLHAIQPMKSTQSIHDTNLAHKSSSLLASTNVQYTQTCGLKYVAKVHRRCKDCKMMIKDGVFFNHCKTHPRHKQQAKTKRPKNTWYLTGVTTSKPREW